MTDAKTIRRPNFTCFHAGPKEDWIGFRLGPPDTPLPTRGKLFLQELLGSAGLEVSLNAVPPGKGIPFLHRHDQNDEVYIVVGGRGQFLVDGECLDVAEGSILHISPAGERAWRNNTEAPLYFLCIQYPADSITAGRTSDGRKVDHPPAWPTTKITTNEH
jgi:mannose-6-phosphate isomerase-like protein (cupin superfamily)